MKPLIVALALPLVFSCSGSLDQTQVADVERERADAITRNDADAYSRLVAPDMVVIDRNGELLSKNDRMSAVDSGRARDTRRAEENVEVRVYGDVALVIGRSRSQEGGAQFADYFTRIWALRAGRLEMVAAHYTDITAQVEDDDPVNPTVPDREIPPLPIATTAPPPTAEDELQRAIREQHRAYWSKDADRYRQYAGTDLLRIAENGIRTREELIAGMQGNARLPAPPSDQLDIRARLFGNTAVATWLDQGTNPAGRVSQNRFTVVFARRGDVWQMVHIHSTGVKPPM